MEKIYDDQRKANLYGVNSNPSEVPCKISYKGKILDGKVRLKGDLGDHWLTVRRMSLKIKLKNGYIEGMREFAIQKPRARQFPYDHIFQKFVNNLSILLLIIIKILIIKRRWMILLLNIRKLILYVAMT